MGGRGSGNDQNMWRPANFDTGSIDEFSKTDTAANYSQAELAALRRAQVNQDGRVNVNGQTDPQLYKDYQWWLGMQANSNQSWSRYSTLAKEQQGRDATILTGPQVSPTLLGSKGP